MLSQKFNIWQRFQIGAMVEFHLYRNTRALPRISFMTNWQTVHSDEEALQAMLRSDYDPGLQFVLKISEGMLSPGSIPENTDCPPAQIETRHFATSFQEFSVSTHCTSYLVFAEPFYPGWNVEVDGKRVQTFPANFAFSAIFLPNGEHDIKRSYTPKSLVTGIPQFSLLLRFYSACFSIGRPCNSPYATLTPNPSPKGRGESACDNGLTSLLSS